jgi:hypothetical protein
VLVCVVFGLFGALHCHVFVSCSLLPMLCNDNFNTIRVSVLNIDLKVVPNVSEV